MKYTRAVMRGENKWHNRPQKVRAEMEMLLNTRKFAYKWKCSRSVIVLHQAKK